LNKFHHGLKCCANLGRNRTEKYWLCAPLRLSHPLCRLQTVSVAPDGAVIAEFKPEIPSNYTILDHAIARAERGLAATLVVGGNPNPEIYSSLRGPGDTM
jgi:hypothetical protein